MSIYGESVLFQLLAYSISGEIQQDSPNKCGGDFGQRLYAIAIGVIFAWQGQQHSNHPGDIVDDVGR